MLYTASSIILLLAGALSYEYGSFHDSTPAFHYIRNDFQCPSSQKIIWDSMSIEVHTSNKSDVCGIDILQSQHPELWAPLEDCLNNKDVEGDEQCRESEEFGIIFQFDIERIVTNQNIHFPCAKDGREPEIVAIHLIYSCPDQPIHHQDDAVHNDILTTENRLPPIPPLMVTTTSAAQRETSTSGKSTKVEETTSTNSVTTEKNTQSSAKITTESQPPPESEGGSSRENVEHALTAHELSVIVGPSVAAIVLVILLAIGVFVLYKRKQFKTPGDLQAESLFNSRRFSTASQISDISINTTSLRPMP